MSTRALIPMMRPRTGWAENMSYLALGRKLWLALWPRVALYWEVELESGGMLTMVLCRTTSGYDEFVRYSFREFLELG